MNDSQASKKGFGESTSALAQSVGLTPLEAVRVFSRSFILIPQNPLWQKLNDPNAKKERTLKLVYAELEAATGLCKQTLYRARRPHQPIDGFTIAILAKALGVNFAALADKDSPMKRETPGAAPKDETWERIDRDKHTDILVVPAPPMWGHGPYDGVGASLLPFQPSDGLG